MKPSNMILAIVCVTLFLRCHSPVNAQNPATIPAGTFVDSEIPVNLGDGELSVETKLFVCTPVVPLKDGQKVAAKVSEDQAWSTETHNMQVGTNQTAYPVLATIKGPDGEFSRSFSRDPKAENGY